MKPDKGISGHTEGERDRERGKGSGSQQNLQYWIHTLCSRRVGCATCSRSNSSVVHCLLLLLLLLFVVHVVVVIAVVGCPFAQKQQQPATRCAATQPAIILYCIFRPDKSALLHVPCSLSSLVESSRVSSALSWPVPVFSALPAFPFPVLCCCAIINNHNSNLLPLYCSLNPVYDAAFVSFLAAKKF